MSRPRLAVRPVCLALLLGALGTACHQRRPMPALPVEPQPPLPEGAVVPPPNPPSPGVTAPSPVPATTYRILATATVQDQVALFRFKPCQPEAMPPACGAQVERTYAVGIDPSAIEGPLGVTVAPDARAFYVSLAHGGPFGRLEKYDIDTGRRLGAVQLGMFPATLDIAPERRVHLRRQPEFRRSRHAAVVAVDCVGRFDDGGGAPADLSHAVRFPAQPAGNDALLRLHDE